MKAKVANKPSIRISKLKHGPLHNRASDNYPLLDVDIDPDCTGDESDISSRSSSKSKDQTVSFAKSDSPMLVETTPLPKRVIKTDVGSKITREILGTHLIDLIGNVVNDRDCNFHDDQCRYEIRLKNSCKFRHGLKRKNPQPKCSAAFFSKCYSISESKKKKFNAKKRCFDKSLHPQTRQMTQSRKPTCSNMENVNYQATNFHYPRVPNSYHPLPNMSSK